MSRPTSYGICALCGKRAPKAAMTRHLATCPASHQTAQGKPQRLFRLRVEDTVTPWYWMDVEIRAGATLEDLDDFLRQRWLECCGHLSAFYIDGATYMVPSDAAMPGDLFADPTERSMTVKLGAVLSPGQSFQHVYDFGTSTELKLRVVDEREGRLGREPLRLLSANEAPKWGCALCDAAAESICTVCMYERNHPFYCRRHATDHECPEPGMEMLLPVVNSPRMGMCGYTGPD
jgi:hypothetical protein